MLLVYCTPTKQCTKEVGELLFCFIPLLREALVEVIIFVFLCQGFQKFIISIAACLSRSNVQASLDNPDLTVNSFH